MGSDTVSKTIWARGGKRSLDIVAGTLLLAILSPLLLLIGIAVKLTSPGPILFSQTRSGKAGKEFRLLKFRTMTANRTPDPKELVPLSHPDITSIGLVLRRLKIDELPQLINVLQGHLSLIGPRPTLPDQVAAYDPFRRQRLLLRPGMTGLAQVNGNALLSWDNRILYDIAYVRNCSVWLDAIIMLRTLAVIGVGEVRLTTPFVKSQYARLVEIPDGFELD